MKRRPWTNDDDLTLADLSREGRPVSFIAALLGRSLCSVYNRRDKLGLTSRRDRDLFAERIVRVRILRKRGLSDAEMAVHLGVNRRTVVDYRRFLGLPPVGRDARYRERVRKKTAEQLHKAGVSTLAELRSKRYAEVKRPLGWPLHLSMRATQILELLYRNGPMTRRQLASMMGMRWMGSRRTFRARVPGGSYTAELVRAGLVCILPRGRVVHGQGKGRSQHLYMVRMEVEPCREELPVAEPRTGSLPMTRPKGGVDGSRV